MLARISTVLVLLACSFFAFGKGVAAQDATPKKTDAAAEAKKSQEMSYRMLAIQRLATNSKMAEELELAPDQRKKIMIASERYRDATTKLRSNRSGKTLDRKAYADLMNKFVAAAEESLTVRQREKIGELAAKPRKRVTPSYSKEERAEIQKLQSMMSELLRLSYDRDLGEKLEITAEQRVEIREAQKSYSEAILKQSRSADGKGFDMEQYNQMIGDMMMKAQDILTPEQVEKLSRSAKLKQMKLRYGDEFGMLIGLADDYELDDEAKAKLREKVQQARKDYYDKIEQLKDDTLEKIVNTLPAKHREEAREAAKGFFEEDAKRRDSMDQRFDRARSIAPGK